MTKQEQATNAQTCDVMCMSEFVRHALRHLEPQCGVEKKSRVRCICLHHPLITVDRYRL